MKPKRYRTEWIEMSAGILLFVLAAGVRLFGPQAEGADLVAAAALFGVSASFLAHVLYRWRLLYFTNIALIAVIYAGIMFWGAVRQNAPLIVFHGVYGVMLVLALCRRTRPDEEAEGDVADRELRNGFLVTAGIILLLLGIACAAEPIAPGWFPGGILPDRWYAYALKSLVMALIGAALIMSVLYSWKGARRHVSVFAAAAAMAGLAAAHLSSTAFESGLLFGTFAALIPAAAYWHFVHIIPPGLVHADRQRKNIFEYEALGKIGFWSLLALGAVYFMLIEDIDASLYFLAVGLGTTVGFVSWHVASIRHYGSRQYLMTILGLVATLGVLLASSGGIESPFIFFAFVLIFAGTVVIPPGYVILLVLALVATLSTDLLSEYLALGMVDHGRVTQFIFVSAALAVTGIYTLLIARRREMEEGHLRGLNQRLEKSVRQVEAERQRHLEEAVRLKRVNEELVEMRTALMNVLEDVEESKDMLETEHLRENAIFEAIGEGVAAADADGKVILFNPAAEATVGIDKEDAIGRPIQNVLNFYRAEEDVLRTEEIQKALQGEGGVLAERLEIQNSGGRRIPVSGTVRPFYDTEDRLSGIVIAFRDVTVEREIDEQKSGFISVASHQLRTPISAMRWYVDLLLAGDAGKLNARQRNFLEDVHTSIHRMAKLVNDLLNVSRAEEGRLNPRPEPVAPMPFLNSIVHELQPAAEEKHITIMTDIPDDLPEVSFDPALMRQVFSNLLANAIKYTPEGGKVGIKAGIKEEKFVVEVWDTGYGIPKGQQHHIFEKFYRGERAISMETVGTGLGLYISKGIISASGGEIWFEAEEDKGTRFYVSLPAKFREHEAS